MRAYLRRTGRVLYLVFFWLSLFAREIDGVGPGERRLGWRDRLRYLVELLPWNVAIAATANLAAGSLLTSAGVGYAWGPSWGAVAIGVAFGVAGGVASGVVLGIRFGVAFGVMSGAVAGIAIVGNIARGVAIGVFIGVIAGVMISTRSVIIGVRLRVISTVIYGVVIGVVIGIILSVISGVALGVAAGLTTPLAFWTIYFCLLTYPFDAALALIALWAARRDPSRAWRWCPARWNEVIWLPLPGLARLLVRLVQHDREAGLRAISFVAAERPLQRRAARAALLAVTVDDLHADSVGRIAATAQKLGGWRVEGHEVAGEVPRVIGRFERIARQVDQYLALQNAFRRGAALDAAVGELEDVQRSLGLSRAAEAPALLQAANGWRRLLEAERERFRAQSAVRREIPNPFVFGNPVGEAHADVFTGRRDLVRLLEASLLGASHAPTLLLYGARRMGKSSIVKQLPRLLGPDFATADLDCQNPAVRESPATLYRYLGRAVSEGLRRRSIVVEPITARDLAREPYAAFDEWLDEVERRMPGTMRVLVCLDEYERLKDALDAGWGGKLLDSLRHTIQHRPRLALMFAGAHTFAELGPDWTDRFISARRLRVSFLTPDEVRPLLTAPIPGFDLAYAPGALEAIIAVTRGQPFLTQAVAFELVQHMNERERKEATLADVEEAIGRALESGGEYFADVWSDAGREGQAILRAVAAGEAPPDFVEGRRWLVDHDVLDAGGRFTVPMMERWVREKTAVAGTARATTDRES